MRLYPPPLFGTPASGLFRWYAVRRTLVHGKLTEVQMVRVHRFLCSASKKPLKSVVQCYKMDRICLIISMFSLAHLDFWHMFVISEKSSTKSLPFVDTYTCLYILSGERLEPDYFASMYKDKLICSHWKSLFVQNIAMNPIKM